jgi:hypothetical protein
MLLAPVKRRPQEDAESEGARDAAAAEGNSAPPQAEAS